MLSLFGSWKKKTLKKVSSKNPIADSLWLSGSLVSDRIDDVRQRHNIQSIGVRNMQVLAFYGGYLEAGVRMLMNMELLKSEDIGILVVSGAIYTDIKNDVIADEIAMHSYATLLEQGYYAPENHDFRILGLKAGLTSNGEQYWQEFEETLEAKRFASS